MSDFIRIFRDNREYIKSQNLESELFLGFTVIGRIGALIMAIYDKEE